MKRILVTVAAAAALISPWLVADHQAPAAGAVVASCREGHGDVAPVAYRTPLPGVASDGAPVVVLACGGGTCKPSPFPGGLPCRS